MMPTGKASGNAVLAKARALYGSRLRADDYRRLMACRTMTELAAALKEYPLYSEALAEVNPQYARRVQLENLLRQSLYTRYDSLCRYDRSAGSKVYEYFTLCCEVDELTAAMRCLDAGRPGDYLFRLPEFLQQRCCIDLYFHGCGSKDSFKTGIFQYIGYHLQQIRLVIYKQELFSMQKRVIHSVTS